MGEVGVVNHIGRPKRTWKEVVEADTKNLKIETE